MPNATWSPPKPTASSAVPHSGGANSAAPPSAMNAYHIVRTVGTENAPPAATPTP